MKRLRELCTQHGALLVFDEVMTGFRVALGGAQSLYAEAIPGFKPDISVFGKVIGGGMPLAAFGATRDVMQQLAPLGPGVPGRHAERQPGGHRLRPRHAARDRQAGLLRRAVRPHPFTGRGVVGGRARLRRAVQRRLRRRHVRLLLQRAAAATLRRGDGHRQGALQPLLPRACSTAASTSRRRCTRPASSARHTRDADIAATAAAARDAFKL